MRRINHSSRFIEMFGNAEKTMPLSDCIGITFPGEWGEDDSDGTGVKVIRTTNFTNSGKLDLTNVVTRKIDPAKIDKKHLIPGDIILERSGGTADNPVGRVVYFEARGTFLFNNFTQLLRCKDGVNSLFVFYSLYNFYHTHKSEIRSMGNKTTGIQNLKMDKYWDIPIADASHEQQDQFVSLYKQADKSKFSDFKSRFIAQFENSDYMRYSFDDICYDDTKSATKIPASEYLAQGSYPIYDQATDSIIAGYSNDSNGVNMVFPAVLFGDHSRAVKYIDRAFYIGADGVKVLRPINADLSTEFLYYQLKFKDVPNTGYNRHFKYLKLFSYCCPNAEEQRAFLAICHQADKSK